MRLRQAMRSYIFTQKELEAIEEFLRTKHRSPAMNKIFFFVKNNQRLWTDIMLFLELKRLAHYKPDRSKPKMMPGRPPKILKSV